MELFREALGPHDDRVATEMNNLAVALGEENKWSEAEALHRSAIAIFKANHPGVNTFVADAENALATALDIQGKNAAAESTYVEVLNMRRQLLGPSHPDYAWTLFNYSMFLSYTDRCAEAVKHSREVLALRGTVIPDSHPSIAASLQTVGRCLDKLGSHSAAESALEESLALRRKYVGDDSWLVGSSESVLGEHFTLVRNFPRAERILLSAQSRLARTIGADNPRTLTNAAKLASLYEAWGRPKDAAAWRAKAGAPPAH
jgi:tetratricopeptide (TPR) repeat protein